MPGRLFERVDSLSRGVDRFLDAFLFRSVGVDHGSNAASNIL